MEEARQRRNLERVMIMKAPIAVIIMVFIGLLFIGAQYKERLSAPLISEVVMDADGCRIHEYRDGYKAQTEVVRPVPCQTVTERE